MNKFNSFHWLRRLLLVVGMLGLGAQQAKAVDSSKYDDVNKITFTYTSADSINAVDIQCEPNDVNTNFTVASSSGLWKVGPIVSYTDSYQGFYSATHYYIRFVRTSGTSSDTFTTKHKDSSKRGTRGRFFLYKTNGQSSAEETGQTFLKARRTDLPALIKLDFNNSLSTAVDNNDANTQPGFIPFTIGYDANKNQSNKSWYSGAEDVNWQPGLMLEFVPNTYLTSRHMPDPNNRLDPTVTPPISPSYDANYGYGTSIVYTRLYRDFACGIGVPPVSAWLRAQ